MISRLTLWHKVKASKGDKKVFNDLNKLVIDINNKFKKEAAVKRLNKSISDLDQLKQKQRNIYDNENNKDFKITKCMI